MKGLIFTEFFSFVEEQFSVEIAEQIIDESDLPSKGAYTTVGTYDSSELTSLVSKLAEKTGMSESDLLKEFGRYIFKHLVLMFPDFFEGITSSFEFLPKVNGFHYLEVRKLYPDAQHPMLNCILLKSGNLQMTYQSSRNLSDFAEGLILGCVEYFGDSVSLSKEVIPSLPPTTVFTLAFLG